MEREREQPPSIDRILVVSTGGDARRVARWAAEHDVETVALVRPDSPEAVGPFTYTVAVEADSSGVWPPPRRVLAALHDAGCDAIHPGWGPVSRSPSMVELLSYSGVAWAGASREALGLALDRPIARLRARGAGLAVVPGGGPFIDVETAVAWVQRVGTPVRIRPVDVEVGYPRPVFHRTDALVEALGAWLAEGPLTLERHLARAREIEVPVLVDGSGACVTVGDREVSLRDGRDHVLVEAPAPGLTESLRDELKRAATVFAQELGWLGLGTVRFLIAPDGRPYLLQMRPGLQPWHGVTELAYGVDLVDAQLRLACREALGWGEARVEAAGHALGVAVRAAGPGVVTAAGKKVHANLGFDIGDAVQEGVLVGWVSLAGPTRQAAIVQARALLDRGAAVSGALNRRALDAFIGAADFWRGPVDRDRAAELVSAAGGLATGR